MSECTGGHFFNEMAGVFGIHLVWVVWNPFRRLLCGWGLILSSL